MKELSADILVVGGGAAGAMAAVSAARKGARVVMVRRGDGATQQSSGAVDVAEHHAGKPLGAVRHAFMPGMPWLDAARAMAEAHPWHPYARVKGCVDAIPRALQQLGEVAQGLGLRGSDDGHNLVLVSTMGTVKRTAWAQGTAAGGDLGAHRDGVTLVVHVPHVVHGDGRTVLETLRHVATLGDGGVHALGRVEPLLVEGLTRADDGLLAPRDLAARLQSPEMQQALVDAIVDAARRFGTVARVLVPPVLGMGRHAAWLRAVEQACGAPVGEWLSAPPSVPGERLQRALDEGVAREGVHVVEGVVLSASIEGRVVRSLLARAQQDASEVRVSGRRVVLCTGKYLTGGIRREERFFEPLLGLPVFIDGTPVEGGFVGDHVAEAPEALHAFMRAGVLTDGALRPVNASTTGLALDNVHAAGSVLSGFDAARQGTGLGLAAVTGLLAGEFANDGLRG
jgi:glycerol-3-phosphate dehydrogenase subunit B